MTEIQGDCAPQFDRMREALAAVIRADGGRGAALAVFVGDRAVVDLWGGSRDGAATAPWERDTIACMFSVSKGVIALCMAMLADRGLLDYDAPVARYWPEFAAAGKGAITTRQILSHVAGLPATRLAGEGALYTHARMAAALAEQAPLWPPGTLRCYHSATLGSLNGEILRRLTGQSLGSFFRTEVAAPLGLDYHIGLAAADQARCATLSQTVLPGFAQQGDYLRGNGWWQLPAEEDFNSDAWRSAEIASANGHGTARAVARLYAVLAAGGGPVIRPAALAAATAEQWRGQPATLKAALEGGTHSDAEGPLYRRMGLGFFLNSPPGRAMGPNREAFGHSGAGGALAYGDPVTGIGFCYAPSLLHTDRPGERRAVDLSAVLYACLRP